MKMAILCVAGFWFLVCYAATQLATPLHQRQGTSGRTFHVTF